MGGHSSRGKGENGFRGKKRRVNGFLPRGAPLGPYTGGKGGKRRKEGRAGCLKFQNRGGDAVRVPLRRCRPFFSYWKAQSRKGEKKKKHPYRPCAREIRREGGGGGSHRCGRTRTGILLALASFNFE